MHIENQPGIKPNTEVLGGSIVVYLVIKSTNVILYANMKQKCTCPYSEPICFLSTNRTTSQLSIVLYSHELLCILENNFKSSAYKRESTVKISLMSFINNKKSKGLRFDPCGMAELTVKRNELNPIYSTYRTLSDIFHLIRYKREGLKPKALNLLRRMLWLSLSKAFEK
jgi:hypothetical protein